MIGSGSSWAVGPVDDASSIGSIFAEVTSHSRVEALEKAAKDEAEVRKVHTESATIKSEAAMIAPHLLFIKV